MANKTNISWTDATWNIARGCSKVDEDCKFCYMYRESMNNTRYEPKQVIRTKGVFKTPLTLAEPSKIFTSSLTDIFHPEIDSFRGDMWDIIRRRPDHTYQLLTKRPERILDNLPSYWEEIRNSVWLGTSIGSQASIDRLYSLILPITQGVKFLSLEPMHGPIRLPLDEQVDMGHQVRDLIDWVIIGGESGNETGQYRYRKAELSWFHHLVEQCYEARIPVFVKQLGTGLAKELGLADRHGADIAEFPPMLQFRQFPKRFTAITGDLVL